MNRCLLFVVAGSFVAALVSVPASAQRMDTNLSSYGGQSAEARAARGFCWDKVGLSRQMNPQTEQEAAAIRNCVDRVLKANVPARSAPPAQSERGRCIQQIPGSIFNTETKRYSNSNAELVNSRCGPAS